MRSSCFYGGTLNFPVRCSTLGTTSQTGDLRSVMLYAQKSCAVKRASNDGALAAECLSSRFLYQDRDDTTQQPFPTVFGTMFNAADPDLCRKGVHTPICSPMVPHTMPHHKPLSTCFSHLSVEI